MERSEEVCCARFENLRRFIDRRLQIVLRDTDSPESGGPGENGEAVHNNKDDPAEASKEKEGYKKYSFNELASVKISLERAIPDNRPRQCLSLKYPTHLPSTSVVIIFHNEAWSTLFTYSIHSFSAIATGIFERNNFGG
ncbi:Polypeptide N-acetylgalactosaminyltransferase 3 [Desmophyllum pertusum]|uniref:Polypeptide N-acetylgalactosaminyltransferase 3 n=1 Tax=Desmophyllum pertusum TaxID=174260 RepID=A0A9X0D0Y0_9CNID|nr:Polypeptide N-acetylgalactosaminyltransferase 3 [Desmophyllum pertusum]